MSVEGGAGGRNFVSANRVPGEEACPAVALDAITTQFPGLVCPLPYSRPWFLQHRAIAAPAGTGGIIRHGRCGEAAETASGRTGEFTPARVTTSRDGPAGWSRDSGDRDLGGRNDVGDNEEDQGGGQRGRLLDGR